MRLIPRDEVISVMIGTIGRASATIHIGLRGIKPVAQRPKALKGDVPPLGLDHPQGEVGIPSVQVHGADVSDQIDRELWVSCRGPSAGRAFGTDGDDHECFRP